MSGGGDTTLLTFRRKAQHAQGYTIIEVMIFLAISGFMFVIAAAFVDGKQAQVDFRQGLSATNTQMRSMVNQVANGEYNPLPANYTCTSSAGGGPPVILPTPTSTPQGQSLGCVFMGKVVQPYVNNDATAYRIYTVVGRQYVANSTSTPVNSFASAEPIPITGLGLTVKGAFQQGTVISGLYYCKGDCSNSSAANARQTIGAFGFFGSFGSYSGNTPTSFDSGAQTVVTASIPGVGYHVSQGTAETAMKSPGGLAAIGPSNIVVGGSYVVMCLQNGSRKGYVTIGGQNGQQFSTASQVGDFQGIC